LAAFEAWKVASKKRWKEEIGITILPKDLNYVTSSPNNYFYKNVPYRTMDLFYECALSSELLKIHAADEIQELIWVPRSEIDLENIGFISIRKVIAAHYLV
jgi:ADP-ribose pyrophosphatase YjhB (NUDIX family)